MVMDGRLSSNCPLFSFLVVLAALAGTETVSAQDTVTDLENRIHWEKNIDAAFITAKKTHMPLFVAFHKDQSADCVLLAEDYYTDPEVVKLSRSFLCLAASEDEHEDRVMKTADGRYSTVCAWFLHVECEDHQRVFAKARRSFLNNRPVEFPFHILAHPDGNILDSVRMPKSPQDLVKVMQKVLDQMEPERDDEVFHAYDEEERKFVADLRRLKGSDPSLRRFVLEKLVRWEGSWVYTKLRRFMDEKAPREHAIHLIREMGFKDNHRAVELLLDLSKHRDAEFRLHAAVSLETIGLEQCAKPVRAWIGREKDLAVRANLLRTLAACAPADSRTLTLIEKELKSGNKPIARRHAAIALGMIGTVSPGVARQKLELLLDDKDDHTAACACWALGWMKSKESLELIKREMEDADTYRMIILIEDVIHRVMGQDPFGYTMHLEKYAGDTIIRGEKWPPAKRDWGLKKR